MHNFSLYIKSISSELDKYYGEDICLEMQEPIRDLLNAAHQAVGEKDFPVETAWVIETPDQTNGKTLTR